MEWLIIFLFWIIACLLACMLTCTWVGLGEKKKWWNSNRHGWAVGGGCWCVKKFPGRGGTVAVEQLLVLKRKIYQTTFGNLFSINYKIKLFYFIIPSNEHIALFVQSELYWHASYSIVIITVTMIITTCVDIIIYLHAVVFYIFFCLYQLRFNDHLFLLYLLI